MLSTKIFLTVVANSFTKCSSNDIKIFIFEDIIVLEIAIAFMMMYVCDIVIFQSQDINRF